MKRMWDDILEEKIVNQKFNPNMYQLDGETFEVIHLAYMRNERVAVYRSLMIGKLSRILALPLEEFKRQFERVYQQENI